jgi:phosphoglycerate kinase
MSFKTLKDMNLKDKVVLLRADLNVPAKNGTVTDTTRIDRLRETIDYLAAHGAKTAILSHFGRPKGGYEAEFSLAFLPGALEKSWGVKVAFAKDCIGAPAQEAIAALKPGQFVLLENLRFHKGEEANDPAFARELAKNGDIYVNDAFSAAHRAHASTEGLAHLLPTAAGFLMEAELNALADALEAPKKPVVAIVGGAKISTKLSVLDNLVQKVDVLVLGGGMANTFLFAKGSDVGKSLCEKDMKEEAQRIMETARRSGCEIFLPADCVAVDEFKENAPSSVMPSDAIEGMAVDIGPQAIAALSAKLETASTVLWNGPLGVFEMKPFDNGTNAIARRVAELTKAGKLVSVAGGGDTVSALENAGVAADFTYISTAGGAFLEWLEGKTLPGVAALTARKDAA